jgi:hypothetical protein
MIPFFKLISSLNRLLECTPCFNSRTAWYRNSSWFSNKSFLASIFFMPKSNTIHTTDFHHINTMVSLGIDISFTYLHSSALPSQSVEKTGRAASMSSKVCRRTPAFVLRNCAHGKRVKHKSMVVVSSRYRFLFSLDLCFGGKGLVFFKRLKKSSL